MVPSKEQCKRVGESRCEETCVLVDEKRLTEGYEQTARGEQWRKADEEIHLNGASVSEAHAEKQ